MNIKSKKIVAKEFLLLIVVIISGVISFLAIYPYNYYIEEKAKIKENEIVDKQQLADSLAKLFNIKENYQGWFAMEYRHFYEPSYEDGENKSFNKYGIPIKDDNGNLHMWNSIYRLAMKDSLSLVWDSKKDFDQFLRHFKIKDATHFKNTAIFMYITKQDIDAHNHSEKVKADIYQLNAQLSNTKSKYVGSYNQTSTALIVMLIAFTLIFILRYFYSAIRWSIKTLR